MPTQQTAPVPGITGSLADGSVVDVELSADADQAYTAAETEKAEQVVHAAAASVLGEFRANPPAGLDPRMLAEIRGVVARHAQDADEMPDPDAHTPRAEVFAQLYRDVLSAQRRALIDERDEGRIDDEAVRAMLGPGVSSSSRRRAAGT